MKNAEKAFQSFNLDFDFFGFGELAGLPPDHYYFASSRTEVWLRPCIKHQRELFFFCICATLPLCRYVAGVNQALFARSGKLTLPFRKTLAHEGYVLFLSVVVFNTRKYKVIILIILIIIIINLKFI